MPAMRFRRRGSILEANGWRRAMLRITVDMFSGLPNPMQVVEGNGAKELLQEIARNQPAIAAMDAAGEEKLGLGYRGLIVEALSDELATKYDLPSSFRIAHTANPKGLEIAERIVSSMRQAQALDAGVHAMVIPELQRLGSEEEGDQEDVSEPPAAPAPSALAAAAHCQYHTAKFNPGFWNDPAHIRINNCYNYGSNRRTDTFAQPGRATGHQAQTMACDKVTAAALSDGLHRRYDCFPVSENPRWLMALVVAPGRDYHWYRKSREGFWGHKPGQTAARNTDNNGAVVMNPETCARGIYTQFCGYFYAC